MKKMNEKIILKQQKKNEITEHFVYLKLSQKVKDPHNKKVLEKISKDERGHYNFLKSITKKEVKPSKIKIHFYVFMSYILGLAFTLRLMERAEGNASRFYDELAKVDKRAAKVSKDELEHEKDLIHILNDEKLVYASSIVLGLNDALVELTGTLAGLTIALANSTLITVTGVVLGFAASLSMAASEYLSSKEEKLKDKSPIKSAAYTGIAYLITVVILVTPYIILDSIFMAFAVMLLSALIVIAAYNYYISVAKDTPFLPRFLPMVAISFWSCSDKFYLWIYARELFSCKMNSKYLNIRYRL